MSMIRDTAKFAARLTEKDVRLYRTIWFTVRMGALCRDCFKHALPRDHLRSLIGTSQAHRLAMVTKLAVPYMQNAVPRKRFYRTQEYGTGLLPQTLSRQGMTTVILEEQ